MGYLKMALGLEAVRDGIAATPLTYNTTKHIIGANFEKFVGANLSGAGLSTRSGEAISFHLDKWGNTYTGALGLRSLAAFQAQTINKIKNLYVCLVHEVQLEVRSGAARLKN